MKRYAFQLIVVVAMIIGFVIILGIAGDIDYCDQVILSMSQEEYDSVKFHLTGEYGHTPSEREIAHWWVDNHNE